MGRRLKHASSKLKGLSRSGSTGLWEARKSIPQNLRAGFGKREFKAALNTKDENEAIRIGAPMLADWADQIEQAKGRTVLATAPVERRSIDRDRAYLAIQRWKASRIKDALNLAFNGELEDAPVGFSDEMRAHVQLVGDLRAGEWRSVPDFDADLSAALNEQGLMCDPHHPAIPAMRIWFAHAKAAVEHAVMEYRKGHLTDAPEAPAPVAPVVVEPQLASVRVDLGIGMKLMPLFELYASVKGKVEPRQRGYVKRLIEYLGDPDVTQVTALQLDAFLIELRKFPNTRRNVSDIPFVELVRKAQSWDDYRVLEEKTLWNWTNTYKALFSFAVDRDLIAKNIAANMMKKPKVSDSRFAYGADDIATIFSTPLFNGFLGKATGYRKVPGPNLVRDHKYWLPIMALWTGARLEELASLHREEIKSVAGVYYIDLSERPIDDSPRRVKNATARRIIPIHDALLGLGFLEHVGTVANGPIFPELDANADKASARFSKWWGHWCHANAEVHGQGLDDPSKVFHSFLHTWKRTGRALIDKEEHSDLMSGHSEGNAVARGYGRGVDEQLLVALQQAMNSIAFPTFPLR